jgi:hypothetical protein
MINVLIKWVKTWLFLPGFILLFSASVYSQNTNDFRSVADGNWNALATWERYNGSAWVLATYYPGNGATGHVTVDNTVSFNQTSTIPSLEINGTLNGSGNNALTVSGNLDCPGTFLWTSNNARNIDIGGDLNISGSFTIHNYSLSVGGTTNISGSFTDNNNGGTNQFTGKVTFTGSGTITSTAVTTAANMVFNNGITQESSAALSFGAANFSVNAQDMIIANNTGDVTFGGVVVIDENFTIQNSGDGTGAGYLLFNSTFTIAADKKATNYRQTEIANTLNGSNALSEWMNETDAVLYYSAAAIPMSTGVFNVDADDNRVIYNRTGGNQVIQITDYYHLEATSGGTLRYKRLDNQAGDITVKGNLLVGSNARFEFHNITTSPESQNLIVEGDLTISTDGNFYTTTNVDIIHTMEVKGKIENDGTLYLFNNANRYTDLTLSGSGEILSGTGGLIRLRNLTLTSTDPKTFAYNQTLEFYAGQGTNAFTNNGGSFSTSEGLFYFREEASITGTGSISFFNLQCGSNNQSIQTLERDVVVTGNMTVNHSNTLNSYFHLNGYQLSLLGDFTRSSSGEFGGTASSKLILGNGNTPTVTGAIVFEDGVNALELLRHNVVNGGSFYTHGISGRSVTISDLEIQSGEFRNVSDITCINTWVNDGVYVQTAGTTTFDQSGGSIAIAGSGDNTFYDFRIAAGTTVTTSNDLNIHNNFTSISDATPAFNATGGTVFFSRNATQNIDGAGTGAVNFYNLTFNSTGNKFIARDIDVTNRLFVADGSNAVYFENSANRNFTFNEVVIGEGTSGRIYVQNSGSAAHTITITGWLEVNSGAYFHLWYSSVRYADLLFTGSGDVIRGTGGTIFYVHSLSFDNPGAKNCSYPAPIDLRGGSLTPNTFTNDGGAFQAANSLIRFRENDFLYTIDGTGPITFHSVNIGVGTRTNVQMNRDITVQDNLIFQLNQSTQYLDLNGYTLTLNGNQTRSSNGLFRGGGTSRILVNGSGNFTSTFLFDQSTPGTTNRIDEIIYNRGGDGELWLGNLLDVNTLLIEQGLFNSRGGSILVNTSATINGGGFIDNANGGTNTFKGILTVEEPARFNPTANSILNFSGSIINRGFFVKEGTGNTNFTANTGISGDSSIYFLNGNLLISDLVTVTNNLSSGGIGVYVVGTLNGAGAGADWDNRGVLTYLNATEPMTTGTLTATFNPNTVIYARDLNTQYILNTTYHHLHLVSGGFRTMRLGDITINGDLLIAEENVFYTQEYQVTGNATGTLTMLEESEMRLGRNVVASVHGFPSGYTRPNIILDPNSLVAYNGQEQPLSHIPIYANLAITNGGNKTLTGDLIVNGYTRMTAGTMVFGTPKRTATLYGDLYASGGRIDMSGGDHDHELELWGIINQANRFSNAINSIVRYASSVDQQVFAPTGGDWYGDIEILGNSTKFLEGSIQVRGTLSLSAGLVRLNEFNLTIYDAASIAGTFSVNNMIETNGDGYLVRQANAIADYVMLYPVGSGGKYTPLTVSSLTGSLSGGNNSRFLNVRVLPVRQPNVLATYDALIRHWDITSTNITITAADASFTFSPLDVIGDSDKYKVYRWNGSAFENPAGSSISGNNMLVPAAVPLIGEWTAYDEETVRETLYSYKDGDWDDIDTWTTDPSGQLLEGSRIPGNSDNVVILTGRTVTLTGDLSTRGLIITIQEGAVLDMLNHAFLEIVSILQGQGTLRLASNQMPNVSLNSIVLPGGGTVEYTVPDASFELNPQPVYNNLHINLPVASNTAILVNDLIVYGDLLVDRGRFQIFRDDASATIHVPIKLDVQGDLFINPNGAITTGTASTHDGTLPPAGTTPGSLVPRYYDVYHKVYLGGDFTNQGSARFISSDITSFDFDNLTSRGAVTVRFYGLENNLAELSGTTDFYNLIIDKGDGISAELTLDVSSPLNFRLFGSNRYPVPATNINPELRKALWIRNGTLRLQGSATIPSLTEGRAITGNTNTRYYIPANGALILDNPNVTVLVTADGNNEVTAAWGLPSVNAHADSEAQEIYVYGKLIINEGYLSTRFSRGVFVATQGGELIVNGGHLSTRQIRTSGTGNATFVQTGGLVDLLGRYQYNTSGISDIPGIRAASINYTESSAQLDGTGTFNFPSLTSYFSMSGGNMNIYNSSGGGTSRALRIMSNEVNVSSTGGLITIHVIRNTQYDIECPNGMLPSMNITRTADAGTNGARLYSNIRINGNLNLQNYAILTSNTQSYTLDVLGNFTIGSNAIYTPNLNRTVFSGDNSTQFTVNGTITDDLYTFEVNKSAATLTMSGTNGDITTRGELRILDGTLNDGGKTITATGNLVNSGIHTGIGKIVIGGALTDRTLGGDGTGVFGNLQVNEDPAITSLFTADFRVTGLMTMTSGSLDLDIHTLRLEGSLVPTTVGSYSENMLFRTAGNASDGGLVRGVYGNTNVLFPIGTNNGGVSRYTPAIASISGFSDAGFLQVNPVALELPTLNQNPPIGDALQYYWKVQHSDFSTVPQSAWVFTYNENDVDGDENLYVPGRVEFATRIAELNGVNTTLNTITFPSHNVARADYTAAKTERFDGSVNVYYSRRDVGYGNTAPWNDPNTWSTVGFGGAAASDFPKAGDLVRMGYDPVSGNHHYVVINSNVECAGVEFVENPNADRRNARLAVIAQNLTVDLTEVRGIGEFNLFMWTTNNSVVTGDFGDFANNNKSTYMYRHEGTAAQTIEIPSYPVIYPNLSLEMPGIFTIPVDVITNGGLTVSGQNVLKLSDGTEGDMYIHGNVYTGRYQSGKIIFPNSGNARTVTVLGDVEIGAIHPLGYTSWNSCEISVETGGSESVLHRLILEGDLILTGGNQATKDAFLNLYTNNTGGANVILELAGAANSQFTKNPAIARVPSLYNLVVNKGTDQSVSATVTSDFTLGAPTDGAAKPLELQNGTLLLDNASIDLELTTGGAFFPIPVTSGLVIRQGRVFTTTAGTGINLFGRLRVENQGEVFLGDGSANDRIVIQYQGLSPELEIDGNGRLEVNTQIRRLTNSTAGSLRYTQTGGEVLIHGRNPNNVRARLEVVNALSSFDMSGGTLQIVRGGGTTFGDLFLEPEAGSIIGGEIIFSQGGVTSNQNYQVNSTIPLYNLTIDPTNSRTANVSLMTETLTVTNLMKMTNSYARFNTNNRNVYLNGNLEFDGQWLYGTTDSTVFGGTVQTITGSPTFNHMKVQPATSLTMQAASEVTVEGSLDVVSGQFVDGGNAIIVKKDVINNASIVSSTPGDDATGLKLFGGNNQRIYGAGSYGLIELDNIAGATLQNSIDLSYDLRLTRGVFNIGSYMLSLGLNAEIVSGSAFSSDNMILTDGVFGNNAGIRKTFPTGASSFTYPIGVQGKYTPVDLSITSLSTGGTVLVKPVNQYHPTVLDPNNVLHYYWYVESNGIVNLNGDLVFNYLETDVYGDEPNYLGTRLFESNWLKFPGAVDDVANTITIPITNASDILGDYSAGLDEAFSNEILTYTSADNGIWNEPANWTRSDAGVVPAGGPSGANVIILPEHTISTNGNRRNAYSLTINGRLNVGTTYGHNFGTVDGTGTLSLESGTLPAGRFDDFFQCGGGTMEYGGTGSYTISNRYLTFENLTITGSGTKTLPSDDITVCNDLSILQNVTLNTISSRSVDLYGDLFKDFTAIFSADI